MTTHVGSARWRRGVHVAVVVLMLSLLVAFTAITGTAEEAPGDAAAGRARFESTCATCHGPDAGGQGTTPAIDDAVARLGVDEVRTTIEDGRGGMPSFGSTLDDSEIDDVVAFLRELSAERAEDGGDGAGAGGDAGDDRPGRTGQRGPMMGMPMGAGAVVIVVGVLLVGGIVGVVVAAMRTRDGGGAG